MTDKCLKPECHRIAEIDQAMCELHETSNQLFVQHGKLRLRWKDEEKNLDPGEEVKDKIIFCKMCEKDRDHMDLEIQGNCRWKCKRCGEYNLEEEES